LNYMLDWLHCSKFLAVTLLMVLSTILDTFKGLNFWVYKVRRHQLRKFSLTVNKLYMKEKGRSIWWTDK
jgi:hypothetical protein